MQGKFDKIIDLIGLLKADDIDREEAVDTLIKEVYNFENENPDYELKNYQDLLQKRDLEWNMKMLEEADVSEMDAQGIMAMLMGLIREERFCDGAILAACESGAVLRWLERLKEIV